MMHFVLSSLSSSPDRLVNFSKGLVNFPLLLVMQRLWNFAIFGLLLLIAQNLFIALLLMVSLKVGVFMRLNTAWSGVRLGTFKMPFSARIWHWCILFQWQAAALIHATEL